MKNKYDNKRYIYDPLYGVLYLPKFIWDIIPSAELQRLREVRLCNINSLCLTGGANINRYEHAIGTCYLALHCLNAWPKEKAISAKEKKRVLLSALLHDVASAGFGHSVEYIESKEGFDHEKAFEYVVMGDKGETYQYKGATFEPIFFGMLREISSKVAEEDLRAIGKTISGKGKFGALISSAIDLDNIDNVFRLAYHIGLVNSGRVSLELAKSLWIDNGKLIVRKEAVPLIEEWHNVRKRLYLLLLRNPEEFSAKCMLSEAIQLAKMKSVHPFNWYDVDYRLLEVLSKKSSETSVLITRLMKGDLYGCIGIFSTERIDKYGMLSDPNRRTELEDEASRLIRSKFSPRLKSAMISIHPIIDVNKTERRVRIETDEGRIVDIGQSSSCLLIGVFFKNVDLNMYKLGNLAESTRNEVRREICMHMTEVMGDRNLLEVELYDEVTKCA